MSSGDTEMSMTSPGSTSSTLQPPRHHDNRTRAHSVGAQEEDTRRRKRGWDDGVDADDQSSQALSSEFNGTARPLTTKRIKGDTTSETGSKSGRGPSAAAKTDTDMSTDDAPDCSLPPLDEVVYLRPGQGNSPTTRPRSGSEPALAIPRPVPQAGGHERSSKGIQSQDEASAVEIFEPPVPTIKRSATVDMDTLLGRMTHLNLRTPCDDPYPM